MVLNSEALGASAASSPARARFAASRREVSGEAAAPGSANAPNDAGSGGFGRPTITIGTPAGWLTCTPAATSLKERPLAGGATSDSSPPRFRSFTVCGRGGHGWEAGVGVPGGTGEGVAVAWPSATGIQARTRTARSIRPPSASRCGSAWDNKRTRRSMCTQFYSQSVPGTTISPSWGSTLKTPARQARDAAELPNGALQAEEPSSMRRSERPSPGRRFFPFKV